MKNYSVGSIVAANHCLTTPSSYTRRRPGRMHAVTPPAINRRSNMHDYTAEGRPADDDAAGDPPTAAWIRRLSDVLPAGHHPSRRPPIAPLTGSRSHVVVALAPSKRPPPTSRGDRDDSVMMRGVGNRHSTPWPNWIAALLGAGYPLNHEPCSSLHLEILAGPISQPHCPHA